MARRKKRIATANRKLGISISCRVQKPVLKDLDAYRKPLKLSRPAALVKLATEHLTGLKEPAEKLWEDAVERMFPAASGVKGDDPRWSGTAVAQLLAAVTLGLIGLIPIAADATEHRK
jgi:hypothetical protein